MMIATFLLLTHLLGTIGLTIFLTTLPRYSVATRWKVIIGSILLALLNSLLSFIVSLQSDSDQNALLFISFCLTPLFIVAIAMGSNFRLSRKSPDKSVTLWAWLTIPVALFMVTSTAIGYFVPASICNGIHRSQLEPVRQGLLAYQADSTRFPLGVQALEPFYIEELPSLLCFGTPRYSLASCGEATVLEMDDFYGEEEHRLFLILGYWESSYETPRTCEPMR